VKHGTVIAGNLASTFQEIEQGSSTVSTLIKEIASATNEQALGVDQINNAVAQLDRATQQIAANSEQLAATGQELNGQSEGLNSMMQDMSRLIMGEGNEDRAPATRPAGRTAGAARLNAKDVKIADKQAKRTVMALDNKYGK
jgi:methyl-accepting chemotaxis protein